MEYHCYILYSPSRNRYYIGHTGDDIQIRIRKHNTNHKGYTGHTGDWQLVYTEKHTDKLQAMQRERYIKRKKSRKFIENLVNGSEHPAP